MSKKKLAALAVFAAVTVALAGCSTGTPGGTDDKPGDETASKYPERTITYVVPYPAGSAPDASARIIAQELENEFGVSVVIDNREGGASTIGLFEIASADADGYTIGLGTASGISITPRTIDTAFKGADTLTALGRTNLVPNVLFTNPSSGWESIEDFIKDAKSRPGEIKVGVPNPGSSQDIQLSLLQELAKIKVTPVYFDAGQQILPVVNGTIDAAIAQPGPVLQYVEKGTLAWVGVFGDAPKGLDVETFGDAGYEITYLGYEGLFGPAGLPQDVIDRLSAAVEKAVASDAYQEYMAKTYGVPSFLNASDFAAAVTAQDKVAAGIVETLGLAG